jgi:hypothetical protein
MNMFSGERSRQNGGEVCRLVPNGGIPTLSKALRGLALKIDLSDRFES